MYDNWEQLEETAKECKKCKLCQNRNNVVFGTGKNVICVKQDKILYLE